VHQKVGGQAALRSGSFVCGCDLNFGYQRRNRSSRSSLRTLVLVYSLYRLVRSRLASMAVMFGRRTSRDGSR